MWQCLHWRNFSTIKETTIPNRMYRDTCNPKPLFSAASGMRWIKASPKSPPAEKLTRYKRAFFKFSSFNEKVNTPTREIKLIITTLTRLYSQVTVVEPPNETKLRRLLELFTFFFILK